MISFVSILINLEQSKKRIIIAVCNITATRHWDVDRVTTVSLEFAKRETATYALGLTQLDGTDRIPFQRSATSLWCIDRGVSE